MNTFKWISRLIAILLLAQLGGLAVAQERITYIHTDALGSPIAASDEDGNFIWRESYQPYGKRLRLQKGSDRPWYTGKYEEDIGLVYYGKRWYNPEIGRFYSVDPARFDENNIHSFNRYAYANNNPYKFVDPDGAVPILPILLWIGAELANLGFEAHDNQANPCSDCVRSSGFGVPGPPAGVIGNRIARNSTSLIPNKLAPKGGAELTKSQLKGIKSLEKQIQKHQQKLDDFKANPTVRPGMENLPRDVIKQQQETRIKHLETEINTFRNNIDKIKNGEL